jgi:hypothetical protein
VSNRCENCWSVSIGAMPVRRPAAPSKYSGNKPMASPVSLLEDGLATVR